MVQINNLLQTDGVNSALDVSLRLVNDNDIRERLLRADLSARIVLQHDLDLDTQHTLPEQYVPDRRINVHPRRVSTRHHVPILELHALRTLSPQLSAHNNLASLRSTLHNKPQHSIARTPHRQSSEQLVPQRLSLRHGTQTAVGDLLRVQLHGSLGKLETLLHNGGQLANTASLHAENVLGARGTDDDLGTQRGHAHLDAGVAVRGKLAGQQLVELGVEDTVGDKLRGEWQKVDVSQWRA